MRESTTYQAILREGKDAGIQEGIQEGIERGRIAEARGMVRRVGIHQFGLPDARTQNAIDTIADIQKLEAMIDRLVARSVTSWDELLRGEQ